MTNPTAAHGPGGQRARKFLRAHFYLAMAIIIMAIVTFGFSFTVGERIIDPAVPRPVPLYVHAVVFTGWLVLFLAQTLLVRMRRSKAHRYLGWFGTAYAAFQVAPFPG